MKQTLPILLVAALVGCTTVDKLQSATPEEQVQSTKSLADISPCLQRFFAAPPIMDEKGRQVFINKNGYGAVLATLTLTPNEQGVLVEERRTGMSITGGWKKCL